MLMLYLPIEPDPSLTPNRRRRSHWSKQAAATAQLHADACSLLNPMVGHNDGIRRYIEQERLAARVDILWRKRVTRFDTDATATVCKPILDAIQAAGIIGNDGQLEQITYTNHYSTTRLHTWIVVQLWPFVKTIPDWITDDFRAHHRDDGFWTYSTDWNAVDLPGDEPAPSLLRCPA